MMSCYPWGWLSYFWCVAFHKTSRHLLEHNGFACKCETCGKWHIRRN
jgi:hypothetical protein